MIVNCKTCIYDKKKAWLEGHIYQTELAYVLQHKIILLDFDSKIEGYSKFLIFGMIKILFGLISTL